MKYTFHVPTQQYGFLEIEGAKKDLPQMEKDYNRYAETPVKFKSNGDFVRLTSFNGETVFYSEALHEYRDIEGNVLLGGSTYAQQFAKPFDMETMLPKCANSWGVPEEAIKAIWDMNRDTSNLLGSAIHLGLELAHKYNEVGETIKKNKKNEEHNYARPKNTIVRRAVKEFEKKFGLDAQAEVLVTNVEKGRAGQIDRLEMGEITNQCRVQDFKTSDMDEDKMKVYQHQLSFYASMLKDAGWTVTGLDIFYWDGVTWTKKELEVLNVKEK